MSGEAATSGPCLYESHYPHPTGMPRCKTTWNLAAATHADEAGFSLNVGPFGPLAASRTPASSQLHPFSFTMA